ncbi:protease synthase and sporulation negative regulatory PAI 1 domain protein [Lapidilactobacillus dextrinicus DSM 20335]|uniref:Protease synthase and sporulation negative regulatory PAI 1 domain protein n=1 Tax=Lapidilactobacillus dextrinicus DSM 20335 TaxID=1423738 RepID=A0A0R2BIM4_9LACO|nr:GNAT family N-acetyltransferase [Lapidilactobacillus dextrinicus]KRM78354.1 protease synthase and sporulation negative regulatory PAI 1 domain protein [Lapidilactobacillus dextrinicus DSM 20335]QFG47346.1 GNAT family N-acetyltransferase [Lapidilactobacillus dextrinicus]
MTTTIRQINQTNLKELQKISRETFADTFGKQNTAADLQEYLDTAYSDAKLTAELQNSASFFYFIEVEQVLAGYLKLNIDHAQTEAMGDQSLEIERIYIKPEFKRQGLGKQLYQKALIVAQQKQKQTIWLGVWEENQPALKFYQRLGFTQFGDHVFQLGDDSQRDLLMRLSI